MTWSERKRNLFNMIAAESKMADLATASEPPTGLKISWREIVEVASPFLEQVARKLEAQVDQFEPMVAPYAHYALTNQGKQLRPALVALSGGAAGKASEDLVSLAVIIEMVHLATLVHDDIMDSAELRRRRPTLAANWGNEISVLLGDCLFAHAISLAAGFPTTEVCRMVASATNTVCSGEILQTQFRFNFELSRPDYFKVVGMKTAALFALSCDLGAGLAGAQGNSRTALRNYGWALGTAYQVYDDCLDLFGSEAAVGKSLGTDLAHGKLTLPLLVVLERANETDKSLLKSMITPQERVDLPRVMHLLDKYDALGESRRVLHEYVDSARGNLRHVPENGSRTALMALADYLARQTDAIGVQS